MSRDTTFPYRGKQKFTRDQLVFLIECQLVAVVDQIECGLPTGGLTYEERLYYVYGKKDHVRSLTGYERGALEGAGMALSILYAQLTGDGMGAGDALAAAARFDEAVEDWVSTAWKNEGKAVFAKVRKFREANTRWTIPDAYKNWPDCKKHAEAYATVILEAMEDTGGGTGLNEPDAYGNINVAVPPRDCDVVLMFQGGQEITIQCRPSNADVDYAGSLDIILPHDQAVTCWEGDDMQPAKAVRGQNHTRIAKQLVLELPVREGKQKWQGCVGCVGGTSKKRKVPKHA